jgi:lipid-A-disaccharide synthase-like uncharacterized protein
MTFSGLTLWWATVSSTELIWLTVGFCAQIMFSLRFVVQWIASERVRRSIVPEAFWYISLAGGLMLLTYAIYRQDPVFILGQSMGAFIYSRNIYLIWLAKKSNADEPGQFH